MARTLAPGEVLVQVGIMGVRAPDGDFIENVPIYKIVSEQEINPKTGLTKGEEKACEGLGKSLVSAYKRYEEALRQHELRNAGK